MRWRTGPDGVENPPSGGESPAKLALRGAAAGKRGSAHREGFFRVSSPRRGDGKIKGKGRPGTVEAERTRHRVNLPMLCVAHLKGVIHARSMVSFGRPKFTLMLEIDDLLCHHLRAPHDDSVFCHDFESLVPGSWSN